MNWPTGFGAGKETFVRHALKLHKKEWAPPDSSDSEDDGLQDDVEHVDNGMHVSLDFRV